MSKYVMPPRQKMINLLYVILIAMLAINISTDALDGYKLLNTGSTPRLQELRARNAALLKQIETECPPEKRAAAQALGKQSDELGSRLQNYREEIARQADKDKYEPGKLQKVEDLNAVPQVFLSVTSQEGRELRKSLEDFRSRALAQISDTAGRTLVSGMLATDAGRRGMTWEKETFSSLPAVGGLTVLNTLEEQVLLATAEVYRDFLAAPAEETQAPQPEPEEEKEEIEPSVMVSPIASGVLYQNYENPLGIYSSGIEPERLTFTARGGTATRKGDRCLIVPAAGAREVVLNVGYEENGAKKQLFSCTYRVKPLPDPTPYLLYRNEQGQTVRYMGNAPLRRADLQRLTGIGAAVEDGPDARYAIRSFETVIIRKNSNEIVSLRSTGGSFSAEQRKQIERLERGDKLYVTSIQASGPRGAQKQIAPINVVIM